MHHMKSVQLENAFPAEDAVSAIVLKKCLIKLHSLRQKYLLNSFKSGEKI